MRRAAGRGPTNREWVPPFRHPRVSSAHYLPTSGTHPSPPTSPPLELEGPSDGANSPNPSCAPFTLLTYLCGRPGRRGKEGPTGSSTAPGLSSPSEEGHCGRGQGPGRWPMGTGTGQEGYCYSGGLALMGPNPGSEHLRDALGTGVSQHSLHFPHRKFWLSTRGTTS